MFLGRLTNKSSSFAKTCIHFTGVDMRAGKRNPIPELAIRLLESRVSRLHGSTSSFACWSLGMNHILNFSVIMDAPPEQ